jgi:hypothetical protein
MRLMTKEREEGSAYVTQIFDWEDCAMSIAKTFAALLCASSIVSAPGFAQQTAPIGSPEATTTIPGNRLPPPDPKFGGDKPLSGRITRFGS